MHRYRPPSTIPVLMGAVLVGLLSTAQPANAQDVGLNVWGMEFATLEDNGVKHMAFYPGMSLSLTVEAGDWAISPSLGAEWAADGEFWGLMTMLYLDRPVSPHVGLDIILAGMHDQVGNDWANAEFFVGAGGGLTWYTNDRVALTPNVLVYYGVRTNTWALAPGVNLWVSLGGT